jgi:hypothetical protein
MSAGVLRLSFAHHVHHLDPAQDCPGAVYGLEPEHRPNPPLDGTMILLNAIVEISALSDPDRLQLTLRSIPEAVCRVTGDDRFSVGLAAVDHNPLWTAMPLESFAQEPFGGRQIAPFAEPELHRVTVAIKGSVKIRPALPDFDVSFINMPLAGDGPLASVEPFEQLG